MATQPLRTVQAVLSRFDTALEPFVTAFDGGQYVLWLGSGISRDRVPNVYSLLGRVIEFLRASIDPGDMECVFRPALENVLGLASLTSTEQSTIDVALPFPEWELRDRILGVLVNRYAEVLDVDVKGKPNDYLVWDVLDVPNTYAAPNLEPDVEHQCIAILMLEGLVDSAVTANWDGLVEKALQSLMPTYDAVTRVIVRPEDFQLPKRPVELVKFHGCAVRAQDDATYRPLLIARHSQISIWATEQKHRLMRKRLELLYAERPTLMLGLSAQDADMHHMFGTAVGDLARPWSQEGPPAVVLSEERLQNHHAHVLKITYGDDYDKSSSSIAESAVLGSFGKPTLLALVLSSLAGKLSYFMRRALEQEFTDSDIQRLATDLIGLRDYAARAAMPLNWEDLDPSEIADFQREFVKSLIQTTNYILTIFRNGKITLIADGHYEPLSSRPASEAIHNPDFPWREFGFLGVALSLVTRGQQSGIWSASIDDISKSASGVLRLITATREIPIFFVKDAAALTELELDGGLDGSDGSTFIVMAKKEPVELTRSPRPLFGRDGKTRPGRFSVASNLADTSTADDLFEAFKLAGGF